LRTEKSPLAVAADGVRVRLRVQPRARRDRVDGLIAEADGGLAVKLAVTAAPEDGKANDAVIGLLAREWGVARSTIDVVVGAGNRCKVVHVQGQPAELALRLTDWIGNLGERK
jgi:uncharacterized protein (TIGR00251 family)